MSHISLSYSITQSEVLTRCLVLALTAPDDIKAQKASDLAEQLAKGLTKNQVERCKKLALKELENV
jgi:hypothetical protein